MEAEKTALLGHRFVATMVCRALGHDWDFMDDPEEKPLMPLDAAEGYLRALAASKHHGA